MRICPQCGAIYDDDRRVCPEDGEETISAPDHFVDVLKDKTLDGRWVIEDLLGEGGMGAVFRGKQTRLNRPVAIKVLKPELAQNAKLVSRFMREARVLSTLRHPHIVTMLDFGRDEETGALYLVMELLEGEPLDEWMSRREELTLQNVVDITMQVARALDEAHGQGMVHRDLKPPNIFVSPVADGVHVKVLDFGIAKVAEEDEVESLTRTGDIQGTPHYMAPEQAIGDGIGSSADLYALGVILFEMISGDPPFDGSSPMSVLLMHVNEPLPSLEQQWGIDGEPNAALVELTERLLSKHVEDRPESAAVVLDELKVLLDRAMVTGANPQVTDKTLSSGAQTVPFHRGPRASRETEVDEAPATLEAAPEIQGAAEPVEPVEGPGQDGGQQPPVEPVPQEDLDLFEDDGISGAIKLLVVMVVLVVVAAVVVVVLMIDGAGDGVGDEGGPIEEVVEVEIPVIDEEQLVQQEGEEPSEEVDEVAVDAVEEPDELQEPDEELEQQDEIEETPPVEETPPRQVVRQPDPVPEQRDERDEQPAVEADDAEEEDSDLDDMLRRQLEAIGR